MVDPRPIPAEGSWRHGETELANVTYVDLEYRPIDAPLPVFDV